MWLNQTTAPVGTPVTLDEAKAHLRVDHNDHDALIGALIQAATQHLDGRRGYLGRCLMTQSWEYRTHCFPWCDPIELPLPPLVSVESVKYIDQAGVLQTLAADQYVFDTATYQGQIRRIYGVVWPVARYEDFAVRIAFTAGFGDAAAMPAPIKHAMLMMIGHLYENCEAVADANLVEVPIAARYLLGPYRIEPI